MRSVGNAGRHGRRTGQSIIAHTRAWQALCACPSSGACGPPPTTLREGALSPIQFQTAVAASEGRTVALCLNRCPTIQLHNGISGSLWEPGEVAPTRRSQSLRHPSPMPPAEGKLSPNTHTVTNTRGATRGTLAQPRPLRTFCPRISPLRQELAKRHGTTAHWDLHQGR